MKRILICTGVLGGGTALVFAAAALAASFAPVGDLVPGTWQQVNVMRGGPVMFGGGGMTKVIGPDGSVTLQNGPINNFGVTTVPASGPADAPAPAVDLPLVVPLVVPPVGTEAP